ncbi:MAG TPA: DUF4349 domain-containing protein [Polyangiaceae bacterium]|jgi:hypothetical protein|nr:DUF4349 domain-containing protein [Polyangiaceae bacterium]
MPSEAYAPESAAAAPPPQAPAEQGGDGYGYSFEDSFGERLMEDQAGGSAATPGAMAKGKPQAGPGEAQTPDYDGLLPANPKGARALIVYSGFLRLQVRRLLDAVDAITKAAESRGGYIESLSSQSIVVRVPSKDFELVMAQFAGFGEVLDRRIQAADVTEQFTDLGARLSVSKEARARLLALLEQTKDAAQRLQIVAEVKRLTEQIESFESQITTLQNLVDFYTISIELVPLVQDAREPTYRSPFAWIRDLSPLTATLESHKSDFDWKLPTAFIQFDKEKVFRAQAADTAMLRAGKIENEPKADAAFWANAVDYEMAGRGEKRIQDGTRGTLRYQVYANDDIKPRYYLVAISVVEADVYVLEVFFPNKASFDRHLASVIDSFSAFQPG